MKEQKNIERLFQEKFKDFEAIPPQNSWDTIASRLNEKKKKKRVVPFWFQLSGIAASLFIIGTLIWNYQSENDTLNQDNTNSIVSDDAKIKTNNNANSGIENSGIENSGIENSAITSSESNELNQKTSEKNKFEENINQNNVTINELTKSKNAIVSGSKENKKTNSNSTIVDNIKRNKISKSNVITKSNDDLTNNENVFNNSNDKVLVTIQNKKSIDKTNNKDTNSDKIDAFFEKDSTEKTFSNNTSTDLKEFNNSKTIVASNGIITKDSTLVAKIAEEKNPLEELLAEKEEGENEDEKEEKRNKWAISTNASPVYFNSLAEGSSLDQQFENNSKSYTTTLSFGIGGSYMISNKLSIRTGVNNINLSYNTNDIVYQTKLNSAVNNNVPSISRNSNGSNVTFTSKNAIQNSLSEDVENVTLDNTGSIKQDLSFIEVPLELSYKILDKKFGIEFIGGMSTLFLNNNTVSLVTDGIEMNVGKANNLNNIHFSSNVGLGFKYSFWKNFNANFQPMFKYQINTFSENSGNFKPYFIGLYSGISFSF